MANFERSEIKMKMAIYILLTIAFLLPILGCGSFNAHCEIPMSCRVGDPRYDAPTPIYGGVSIDCDSVMDCIKAPISGVEKKKHSEEWWNILLLPFPIIDIPLSFVFDTIALPWDIDFWPKWSEAKENRQKWDEEQEVLKKDKSKTSEPTPSKVQFVFVKIPEQIQPLDRRKKYEDPLNAALKKEQVGEVSGGGTQLSASDADGKKSIEWVGVDVYLSDFDKGMPILNRELFKLGAPEMTVLEYIRGGKTVEEKLR